MASRLDLGATQRLVWELITAPEGAGPGAEALASAGLLPAADVSTLVRGDERVSSTERLDIYANMYFFRLRDALAEDFPKVAATLGGVRFHNLVTDFLLVHPSTSWTLRDLGRRLPTFLEAHPLRGEFPFVADLARLEWARLDVFDEADAEPLRREAVARLAAERVGELRLGLVPACRLLDLSYSVARIWREVEAATSAADPAGATSAAIDAPACRTESAPFSSSGGERRETRLRVWRKGFAVLHRTMPVDERAALERVRQGTTLPELADALAADGEGPEEALARRLAEMIDLWTTDEILRALPPGSGR